MLISLQKTYPMLLFMKGTQIKPASNHIPSKGPNLVSKVAEVLCIEEGVVNW